MLIVIWCPFQFHVTAVAHKRPRSLCRKRRWQVTPKNTCTFDLTKSKWAYYAAVQAQLENLSGIEPTRGLSGNIRRQSSQLAEPLCTDPGIKSGISVRELVHELISTLKKKKKCRRGLTCQTFSQNPHT